MAVRAGNIDSLALVDGVTGAPHQADARMAIDATHAGQVVSIGGHALDMPAVWQTQSRALARLSGNIDFREARIAK